MSYFQRQLARLRQTEISARHYRMSAAGYLTELDKMTLEVRQYLALHPTELSGEAAGT